MTHQRGPVFWTIAIYGLKINSLTKMAKEVKQRDTSPTGTLSLSLSLYPTLFSSSLSLSFLLLIIFFSPEFTHFLCNGQAAAPLPPPATAVLVKEFKAALQ